MAQLSLSLSFPLSLFEIVHLIRALDFGGNHVIGLPRYRRRLSRILNHRAIPASSRYSNQRPKNLTDVNRRLSRFRHNKLSISIAVESHRLAPFNVTVRELSASSALVTWSLDDDDSLDPSNQSDEANPPFRLEITYRPHRQRYISINSVLN